MKEDLEIAADLLIIYDLSISVAQYNKSGRQFMTYEGDYLD